MAFVRAKNIKGQKYAYLVENSWTQSGSRQKVLKYLGKIHVLGETGFAQLNAESLTECITGAVKSVLEMQGFTAQGSKFSKEPFAIDLNEKTVRDGKKAVVLQCNEGYICDHTLKELLEFNALESHDETARKLATALIACGIKVTPEHFAQLFELAKPKEEAKQEFYY